MDGLQAQDGDDGEAEACQGISDGGNLCGSVFLLGSVVGARYKIRAGGVVTVRVCKICGAVSFVFRASGHSYYSHGERLCRCPWDIGMVDKWRTYSLAEGYLVVDEELSE